MKKLFFITVVSLVLAGILTGGLVYLSQNKSGNSTDGSNISYTSSEDLTLDMSRWQYDEEGKVYYQLGIVYASNPSDTAYQSMGIYVPAAYMDSTANGDGTYTCTLNSTAKINGYTALTAPVVMPVNTPGYSAQSAPTSYSYNRISSYIEAGFIYAEAGCRGRETGAPWGVTDLKSAIRYLRYNADSLAGDESSLFVFGMSGGGAQSAVLGASGDSDLYTDYLNSVGALMTDKDGNALSDAVKGVMAWCPITSLDTADEAYEWNMGQYQRDESSWTSALSVDMAQAYADYINKLKLTDENGNVLSLDDTNSGSYYDYILSVISTSLTNYLNDTYESEEDKRAYVQSLGNWASYDSETKTATVSDMAGFVNSCKGASKSVAAFDSFNLTQAENYVFGEDSQGAHFDSLLAQLLSENKEKYASYSDFEDYSGDYSSAMSATDSLSKGVDYRVNMYNPMYYLCDYYEGKGSSDTAQFWRIRTGIAQGDTALTVEANLALALEADGKDVDFETVWGQGHTMAERSGNSDTNFIEWVNACMMG